MNTLYYCLATLSFETRLYYKILCNYENDNIPICRIRLEEERDDRELQHEERRQARQLKYLTERLTQRQAQVYFEYTYLKLKKVQIAKNMHITEGAVRKLILKAEDNLKKLRQKEIEEDRAEIARIQETIKDNAVLLSAQEKVRKHQKLTKEEGDELNLHFLRVLFKEI